MSYPSALLQMVAVLRTPAPTLATQCELTHLAREPIEFARILDEHAAYAAALREHGVRVDILPALGDAPDSVFVEDAAIVLDELVLLTRPGAASRQAEPLHIRDALSSHRPRLVSITAPGTLDGGDVLRIGRTLLVGRSTRSNAAGIEQLARLVADHGYSVRAVPVSGALHLKTACTALDDTTLLVNPAWLDPAQLHGFDLISVADGEAFAANVLRLPGGLLVNAAYPRTRERVEQEAAARGARVSAVDIGEFGKAEAGLTCLSLVFAELIASN